MDFFEVGDHFLLLLWRHVAAEIAKIVGRVLLPEKRFELFDIQLVALLFIVAELLFDVTLLLFHLFKLLLHEFVVGER